MVVAAVARQVAHTTAPRLRGTLPARTVVCAGWQLECGAPSVGLGRYVGLAYPPVTTGRALTAISCAFTGMAARALLLVARRPWWLHANKLHTTAVIVVITDEAVELKVGCLGPAKGRDFTHQICRHRFGHMGGSCTITGIGRFTTHTLGCEGIPENAFGNAKRETRTGKYSY